MFFLFLFFTGEPAHVADVADKNKAAADVVLITVNSAAAEEGIRSCLDFPFPPFSRRVAHINCSASVRSNSIFKDLSALHSSK